MARYKHVDMSPRLLPVDLGAQLQFRRRGIALALLSELTAEGRRRGCKSLYVEVGERNQPAIELYRRIGLEPFSDGRVLHQGAVPDV